MQGSHVRHMPPDTLEYSPGHSILKVAFLQMTGHAPPGQTVPIGDEDSVRDLKFNLLKHN